MDSNRVPADRWNIEMNPALVAGTRVVILALLSYTAAAVIEQRKRWVANLVLIFQSVGMALDITATTLMIIGSRNTPFTVHGVFGYSALAVMVVKTALLWRFRLREGMGGITQRVGLYSWLAYGWWLVAFILGSLLVFLG